MTELEQQLTAKVAELTGALEVSIDYLGVYCTDTPQAPELIEALENCKLSPISAGAAARTLNQMKARAFNEVLNLPRHQEYFEYGGAFMEQIEDGDFIKAEDVERLLQQANGAPK